MTGAIGTRTGRRLAGPQPSAWPPGAPGGLSCACRGGAVPPGPGRGVPGGSRTRPPQIGTASAAAEAALEARVKRSPALTNFPLVAART